MILRSVTSRLVFFYCLLLVLLGGAFLAFTVLSFQHYTRETLTSMVDVYIGHLRRKLDEGREKKLIRTVRGLGYVFDDAD